MQPEEIFRYVASRAPRPRRLRIDLELVAELTPFMRALLDDLRTPGAHDRAIATVDDFLASSAFVERRGARPPILDQLDRFHARFRREPPANAGDARALVDAVFDRSASALIASPEFAEAERDSRDAVSWPSKSARKGGPVFSAATPAFCKARRSSGVL